MAPGAPASSSSQDSDRGDPRAINPLRGHIVHGLA
jgi:hypothetical protein